MKKEKEGYGKILGVGNHEEWLPQNTPRRAHSPHQPQLHLPVSKFSGQQHSEDHQDAGNRNRLQHPSFTTHLSHIPRQQAPALVHMGLRASIHCTTSPKELDAAHCPALHWESLSVLLATHKGSIPNSLQKNGRSAAASPAAG